MAAAKMKVTSCGLMMPEAAVVAPGTTGSAADMFVLLIGKDGDN